jgi:hypothetical protein
MQLRKHSTLKFLAILLFCLELLAPTALSAWVGEVSSSTESNKSILSVSHCSALSLFVEEEIEERDSRNDSPSLISTFDIPKAWLPAAQNTLAYSIANNQQKYQTQPLLFKKHCLYLI